MKQIPTTADGARRSTVDIQGIGTFTLRTYYRHIGSSFLMDLHDATGTAILIGVPLVAGVSLLNKAPRSRDSLGQWRMTADSSGPESLGDSAQLIQFDPGEFEQLSPAPVVALTPIVANTALLFRSGP
ncbi:phage baseplate plug protein [Pseudomonas fragi]|jgi:hypothetical protein|uniref:phage baseplate plug family protein n=1 Tax=Pseudomonas fragi TaxID=296 RepID=UPI0028ECB880|nr:hypothetical protein [Pseudomonas fragi]